MTGRFVHLIPWCRRQRGATAVEFALVALLGFLPLLLGIVQMGLVFFAVNFATEATRYVARTAVVCDATEAQQARTKAHVMGLLPGVFQDGSEITISYGDPAACLNPGLPCTTVSINPGVQLPNFIPGIDLTWTLPTLRTTLTPESFASAIDGHPNPVCN